MKHFRLSNLSLLTVTLIRRYYREATPANKSNNLSTMFVALKKKYDTKRDGSNTRDPSPMAKLMVLVLCCIEAETVRGRFHYSVSPRSDT